MTPLAPHITAFFEQRLPFERRASEQTRDSYAYAFKLFLTYASTRLKVTPSQLAVEHMDAPLVVAFLGDLDEPDRLARAPPLREPCPEARHVTHDLNTACGGGGHDWSLCDAFVLHPAVAVANPPRVLARTRRIEDQERSPDALIAMVDIGAGSGYSCPMFRVKAG